MKKILKKKTLVKLISAGSLSIIILNTSIIGYQFISAKVTAGKYASNEQVDEIAQALNCDTAYLKYDNDKQFTFLQHNNGKPIYVAISPEMPEKERGQIISTLDHVFGLVGEINSNYHYSIVDEDELSKQKEKGRTTINYTVGSAPESYESASGLNTSFQNMNVLTFTDKHLNIGSTIFLNQKKLSQEDNSAIFLHETLHSFGFDDVYSNLTTTLHQNTVMYPYNKISIMTPNDYKCLIATCSPQFSSEKEKEDFIEKFSAKVNDYERTYCAYAKDYRNISPLSSKGDFHFEAELTYRISLNEIFFTSYHIDVKDDKYKFSIFDENENLLDETTGKTIDIDGVRFLTDVRLEKGMQPNNPEYNNPYYSTFAIGNQGKYSTLFNVMDNNNLLGSISFTKDLNKAEMGK